MVDLLDKHPLLTDPLLFKFEEFKNGFLEFEHKLFVELIAGDSFPESKKVLSGVSIGVLFEGGVLMNSGDLIPLTNSGIEKFDRFVVLLNVFSISLFKIFRV